MLTCSRGAPFWEMLGGFPQNLMVNVLASAILHRDHYAKQLWLLRETPESLRERFSVEGAPDTIEEVLEAAARNMINSSKRPSLAHVMFLAGALGRDVRMYNGQGMTSSPPCPCTTSAATPFHFVVDKGERTFPLAEKAIFGIQDLSKKVLPKTHNSILRMEDERIILYKNLEVRQCDYDRLTEGNWLDDHIVDICITIYRDQIQPVVSVLPSSTGVLLQEAGLKKKQIKKPEAMYLLPVCTGNKQPDKLVSVLWGGPGGLPTISLEVPKQSNGNDCGVYTVLFARELLKLTDPFEIPQNLVDPKKVERSGRQELAKLLEPWTI